MYNHFQNLKKQDNLKKLFHLRGQLGPDYNKIWLKYELVSGFNFRLSFKIKPYNSISVSLGLFIFTAYLSFPFFSFKKWIKESKETYLYWYDWALVYSAFQNEWSSKSGLPWYKSFYFHVDDFFLGKVETIEADLISAENVWFKIGEKEFVMNSIGWKRRTRIRRHIPYTLWRHTYYSVEMKIDKPPMHQGKGENSYDLGDDGTYGLYSPWDFETPTYHNRKKCIELAVKMYVDGVFKDNKKYGSTSAERGTKSTDKFEFIGFRNTDSSASLNEP